MRAYNIFDKHYIYTSVVFGGEYPLYYSDDYENLYYEDSEGIKIFALSYVLQNNNSNQSYIEYVLNDLEHENVVELDGTANVKYVLNDLEHENVVELDINNLVILNVSSP
jgi:hypothetical protein